MATAAKAELNEIAILRTQNRNTHWTVQANTEGLTHQESLIQPHPGGNCMNWVVGHLVCVYNNVLAELEHAQDLSEGKFKRYDRGSAPIQASDALDFATLLRALQTSVDRFDAALQDLTPEALDAKAPFSPGNNPNETLRSLMGTIVFHQAYHAGQTGLLRRLAGKAGAIR